MKDVRLWDSEHPYYATEGCYYVSGALGHRGAHGPPDGNTCHADFASWADFKAGRARPYSSEMLESRRQAGVVEETAHEWSWLDADDDLNLLYRWDWNEIHPDEYDEGSEGGHGPITLSLYYILQRKARPHSIIITVTREDELEIRAWLEKKWNHLQRLWTPLAPDIPPEASEQERNELTMLHYGERAKVPR